MESPLNRDAKTLKLRSIDPNLISKKWHDHFGIDLGEGFRSIDEIAHWQCQDTGLEWYTPANAAAQEDVYKKLSKFPWYYMPDKWEFLEALNYIVPDSKILEVGSGSGQFLKLASNAGFSADGIELNKEAAEESKKCGFNIYSSVSDVKLASYDVVCCFQVLEHISDPILFLKDLISRLKVNGLLIVSVPNLDILQVIDPGRINLLDQPPHHMSCWRSKSLIFLGELIGLNLVKISFEPIQNHHISWYINTYLKSRLFLFSPVIFKLFSKIIINSLTTLPVKFFIKRIFKSQISGLTQLAVFKK